MNRLSLFSPPALPGLIGFVALSLGLMSGIARGQVVNSEWNTGNGAWNVPGSWLPADVPDNGDGFIYNVQIGNRAAAAGAQVSLVPEDGTSDTITSLTVTNSGDTGVSGADLLTSGNQLIVLGQTTINGAGSTIRVDNHATPGTVAFNTNTLDLNNGGGLVMEGGIANIAIQFEINSGTLVGHGTVTAGDNDAVAEVAFENSSLIQPSSNSAGAQTLTLRASGADTLDLDGTTESGNVDVSNALANVNADTVTLVVDGPLSDAFSGTLQIGQRDTVTFTDPFTMDGAAVQMNGGTQAAALNGAGNGTNVASTAFTITGDAVIANNLTFTGPANTVTVNASGSLTLDGSVSTSDASMLSLAAGSELIVNGSLTVIEAAGDIDWDGTGNNATTTIAGSGHLTLTVDQVDVGNNIFNGTLNLEGGGDLTVNNTINSWQAAGIVHKNGTGTSSVNGDEIAVTGDLVVSAGTLDVNAAAIFGSTSDVIIASNATADMGTTEIHDGADVTVNGTLSLGAASLIEAPATLTGSGLLRFNSTSTIAGNAVVNTASFDWDGLGSGTTHTINDGVVFTVNSTNWDPDDTGDVDDNINLGGNGAGIVVNNVSGWTMARTLNANTAAVGTATIGGTSVLTFDGPLAVLNVDGDTDVASPVVFGASSTAAIDAGMTLDLGASAGYAGGTIGGVGTFISATTNSVTASSTINAATFDFDAGNWTVQDNALLTINVTDYDAIVATNAFDTTISLNNGDISVTTADAEFVMDGTLIMNSSVDGQITAWNGEPLDIGNDSGALDADLNVTGTRQSQIAALLDFNSDADVNVAAGATLHLLNSVSFDTVNGANNAEFTGAGTIACSGVVSVNEAVTLNMPGGTVDLDGLDNVGDFVNIDAPLVINADTMANFGRVNGGGGVNTLDINNSVGTGTLTVNLDDPRSEWTLNGPGVTNLVNDNTEATLLTGSGVNLNGTVNVTGDVRSTARLDIAGVVNINTAAQPLRLGGGNAGSDVNTIAGGTISGTGLLGADTGRALHGFGTIGVDVDFDGTANLLAERGTLNVTGAILDVNQIGTNADNGVLNVLGAWNTLVAQSLVLRGGEVRGGAITNAAVAGIVGNGLLSARVINNTTLTSGNSSLLVVQTAGNDNDWDGTLGSGTLGASSSSTLELRDNALFAFTGTVQAANGGRVFSSGFAFDFNPGSTISLTGGTYESTHTTDIGGTVTVGAGADSTLRVQPNGGLDIESGSTVTLNGNLRLDSVSARIETGAVFSGTGALIVAPGGILGTAAGLNLDVLLDNQGTLQPGNSETVGRVDLRDYQQAPGASLFIEVTGTGLNQFDRVVVNGAAQLRGRLDLDMDGGFVPVLGQTFDVLAATGGVSGEFDAITTSGMPAGLKFNATYLPNAVRVTVAPLSAYDVWLEQKRIEADAAGIPYDPADLGKFGDADHDGQTNIVEFALDGQPFIGSQPDKVFPKIAPVSGSSVFTMTIPVRNGAIADPGDPAGGELVLRQTADELTYRIQAGDVPGNAWTLDVSEVTGAAATAIQSGLPALSTGWTYRTFRSPGPVAGDPREFMRAVISE